MFILKIDKKIVILLIFYLYLFFHNLYIYVMLPLYFPLLMASWNTIIMSKALSNHPCPHQNIWDCIIILQTFTSLISWPRSSLFASTFISLILFNIPSIFPIFSYATIQTKVRKWTSPVIFKHKIALLDDISLSLRTLKKIRTARNNKMLRDDQSDDKLI